MISAEDLEKQIEALVVEHGKKLECYLRGPRVRLPEFLVGDAINDALLVVADKLRRGHTFNNAGSYLFRVARNAAIDRLKVRYAGGIPDLEALVGRQGQGDMLADAETNRDLRHAIGQLSSRQQQVIELRYLRDFTVAETAEILGIAPGTVGPTTKAALRRLKQIITKQSGAWEEETE